MNKIWKIAGINFDHFHMGDLLRLVHDHPHAEIVGISDEQPQRMVDCQKNFALRDDKVFTDYRACLEQTRPDMVILCPAAARHADWVEKALKERSAHVVAREVGSAVDDEESEKSTTVKGAVFRPDDTFLHFMKHHLYVYT